MEKRARVEEGLTPSVVSGKPCDKLDCKGNPVCEGEISKIIRELDLRLKEEKKSDESIN